MRKLIKFVLLPLAIIMLLVSIYSYNVGFDYEARTLKENEVLLVEDKDWYDDDNINFIEFTAPANTTEITYAFSSGPTEEATPSLQILGGGAQVSGFFTGILFPKLGMGFNNIGEGLVKMSVPQGRFDCNAGIFTADNFEKIDCVLNRVSCQQTVSRSYPLPEPQRLFLAFTNEDSWNNIYVKASIVAVVQVPVSPIPMIFWGVVSLMLILVVANGRKKETKNITNEKIIESSKTDKQLSETVETPIVISIPEPEPIRHPEPKLDTATIPKPAPIIKSEPTVVVELPKSPQLIPTCSKKMTHEMARYNKLCDDFNDVVNDLNAMLNKINDEILRVSDIKNLAITLKNDKKSNVNKAKCETIIKTVDPIMEKYKITIDRNRETIDEIRDLGEKIDQNYQLFDKNPNYANSQIDVFLGELRFFKSTLTDIRAEINAPNIAVKKLQNDFDTITNN